MGNMRAKWTLGEVPENFFGRETIVMGVGEVPDGNTTGWERITPVVAADGEGPAQMIATERLVSLGFGDGVADYGIWTSATDVEPAPKKKAA